MTVADWTLPIFSELTKFRNMQHRYFGDVGDFGKYGLLKILCGLPGQQSLRLGIVWYLFPDEGHNEDGKYVNYLWGRGTGFRDCDEALYDKLRELIIDSVGGIVAGSRHLNAAERGLMPHDTIFYSEPLQYPKTMSTSERHALRKTWFANAIAQTSDADVVFLDPDNGIECKSVKRTRAKGPKYVYWDDIDAFVERGQSVVVYHHLGRTGGSLEQQVESKLQEIGQRYGKKVSSNALIFGRGTNRAHFIIAASRHSSALRERAAVISSGNWGRHFRLRGSTAGCEAGLPQG